jgi:hypothetical protein
MMTPIGLADAAPEASAATAKAAPAASATIRERVTGYLLKGFDQPIRPFGRFAPPAGSADFAKQLAEAIAADE